MNASKQQKRGRPAKDSQGLNKEAIINVAKEMMLASGKVPSIRSIATKLQVDPMALYYYFNNKSALLEAITVSLISSIYLPKDTTHWQQELIKLAKSYLTILRNYDGLLPTLLSMNSSSPADIFIERFRFVTEQLALCEMQQKYFLDLVVDYLHGFSIAMTCDNTNSLTLDDIEQPLSFLFNNLPLKASGTN